MRNNKKRLVARIIIFVLGAVLVPPAFFAPALAQTWYPPEPSAKERDWLKFTSGEWLWGELKEMRDTDLKFDSEKLETLELDWDDVAEFRSARPLTYRFEHSGIITGTAIIREGTVSIRTRTGVRELPRDDLIMILEGTQREIDFWTAGLSVGFVGRRGNTDQADFNAAVKIRRQAPRSRWDNNYRGNMGRVSGEQNVNNHNYTSIFDMLIKAGFFITPGMVNLFKDKFQNIDLKTTVAAGGGYAVFRGGDVDWTFGLKGGYVYTRFGSVQEGEDDKEGSFAVIYTTDLEWDITKNIEFDFEYSLQMLVPESRNAFHSAAGVFSLDIWGDILDLDVALVWDRVESPKLNAEGNLPVRDDFRTSIGIGLDL